ncbi:MAG: hypothetical protein HYZ23_02520 [Chloroflexi bacterium]|nr:hypothetical protein [Chloroflexota bacterium]
MNKRRFFAITDIVFIIAILTAACGGGAAPEPQQTQDAGAPVLFDAAGDAALNPSKPHIVRARYVTVDLSILLDESGTPRALPAGTEITLNLFPDIVYTAVIDKTDQSTPGSFSWVGHLKDVEFSEAILIYSGNIFIAHVASPAGVYEVSISDEDLYQVIQIDQSKLPQDQ